MAEFISIPLRNIKNLLVVETSSEVRRKLVELQSLLIHVQQDEDQSLSIQVQQDEDQSLSIQVQQDEDRIRSLNRSMTDVIDLAYKVDDELDTFLINAKSYGRSIESRIPSPLKSSAAARRIGLLIRSVKNSNFAKSRYPGRGNWNEKRSKHHHSYDIKEHSVRSTEDLTSVRSTGDLAIRFIAFLTDEKISPVIDITGVDGLGKTSVVETIYNDIEIRRYFQAFAWVSIPKSSRGTYKLINLCRDILKQLLSNDKKDAVVMPMEEEELMEECREMLTDYKCLVVVDATNKGQFLSHIYRLVPRRLSKGKVLFRNRGQDEFQQHSQFSREAGRKLLKMTTFGNEEKEGQLIPSKLEEIGMELVEMCNYISPLISIVGRVLSENKFSSDHWKKVKEFINQGLEIASVHAYGTPCRSSIIVALSYDQLPIHLRACFLYLGQFQKDEDINAEMLYQMWIAEGMVSSHLCDGEETTMDIAEEYLAELASRFLIQVQVCDFSTTRRFMSCRVHNVVKSFCQEPVRVLKYMKKLEFLPVPKPVPFRDFKFSSQDGRRLSLHLDFSGKKYLENADNDVSRELELASENLRCLLICNANGVWRVQISFEPKIYKKFKLLRVLKIENFEIEGGELPKEIRNLIHLRFLSLKGSAFEKLPSSIENFRFLQTLDLRVAEIFPRGIVVPNVLWKLKELRHLYLPACHLVPKGQEKLRLNGLSKLETLVNFDCEKDELPDSEWKSLRHIDARVHGKKNISDAIHCINSHGHKLKETFLHVCFSDSSFEESCVPLEDVFNCSKLHHLMVSWGRCELNEFKIPNPFSSNLIELCLMWCQIKEDPMQTLGKFPRLLKLVLGKRTFMGKHMKCESDSFPALRSLKIKNLMHLEKLEIPKSSMPSLSCLEIVCCPKLETIPDGLTTLKELKLSMPKEFNDRVRREEKNVGEDFYKVRNVPFISLEDW